MEDELEGEGYGDLEERFDPPSISGGFEDYSSQHEERDSVKIGDPFVPSLDLPTTGYAVSLRGRGKFRRLHRIGAGCNKRPGVDYYEFEAADRWEDLAYDDQCTRCFPMKPRESTSSSSSSSSSGLNVVDLDPAPVVFDPVAYQEGSDESPSSGETGQGTTGSESEASSTPEKRKRPRRGKEPLVD